MNNIYEKAKANYPHPWNKAMLKNLVRLEKLTPEEYEEITGEVYA